MVLPFWASAELTDHGFASFQFAVPLSVGLACFIALLLFEYHQKEPLSPVKPMWTTASVVGTLVAMIAGGVFVAFLELGERLQMEVAHRSPLATGILFWPLAAGVCLTAIMLGVLITTRFLPLLVLGGMVCLMGGGALIPTLGAHGAPTRTLAAAGLLGLAAGATVSPGLYLAAFPQKPLYFVDATHPAYTGHPACGWIKKGQTRELKSNHGRVNVTVNGALSWPEREVVRREAGKITSAAMIELFDDLAARHPTATAIRVVLDNASYNHSKQIKAYLSQDGCRITLVYLPPYAPNLNLIERLWCLMKKKALWNQHYPCLADFKAAINRFFDNIASYHAEIASLITGAFHFIGASNPQAP